MRVVNNSSVLIALGGIGRLGVIPAKDARCEAPERLRYGRCTGTPFQVHRLRGSCVVHVASGVRLKPSLARSVD